MIQDTYINKLFKAKEFDVKVSDGQLTLDFDAYGAWWCMMLNGMVIFPKSEETDGVRWLANLNDLRKEQYNALHVEDVPPAPAAYDGITEQDKARGYVAFAHSPDRDIQVNSQPTAAEVTAKLGLSAAPGEYEDACIGVLPLKDCIRDRGSCTALQGA